MPTPIEAGSVVVTPTRKLEIRRVTARAQTTPNKEARPCQKQRLSKNDRLEVGGFGTEGETDAELSGALCDDIGQQANCEFWGSTRFG